jgi:opacity protein-like surface antigen
VYHFALVTTDHDAFGPSFAGRESSVSADSLRAMRRLVLTLAAMVAAMAASASFAAADVLVNAPAPSVACGQSLTLGVWYQSYSGGPRWAHITVRTRAGGLAWSKNISAATTTWRYWHLKPACGTRYIVTYLTAAGPTRFNVHVQ